MPNKVLDQFPWVRTDAIPVSGTKIVWPKTLWDLSDNPLRAAYIGLFRDWIASRPAAERPTAAVDVLVACWDAGLGYTASTAAPGQGAGWARLTPFVAGSPLLTWQDAHREITAAAALYQGDFYAGHGALKQCVRDNMADARAAAKGFLAGAIAEGGAISLIATIAAMGPVKKQFTDGYLTLAVLADDPAVGTPWKEHKKVIDSTVQPAFSAYGKAEGELRTAAAGYLKTKPKADDPAFNDIVQKVENYNKAAQDLGTSLQKAAEEAQAFIYETAVDLIKAHPEKVMPQMAEGLLAFDTCMYLLIGMLAAASPACPPLAIAATGLTIAQKATDVIVKRVAVSDYLKKNPDAIKKMMMVKAEKDSLTDKAAEMITGAFDYEQIGEGTFNAVVTTAGELVKNHSAMQSALSNGTGWWQVYTGATAQSTPVASAIFGGYEMAKQFADYDPTEFEISNSQKISDALDEIKRLSERHSPLSRSYVIHGRVAGSDGVYTATIGGVKGTLNALTQQFTPADFGATFDALAPKAQTSAGHVHAVGSGSDTYHVRVRSEIALGTAKRERYDVKEGWLVLSATIKHTVTEVTDRHSSAPALSGDFSDTEDAAKVTLATNGELARADHPDVPVLAARASWLETGLYVPLRYRYPLHEEGFVLSKDHPYLQLGYAEFTDEHPGEAPRDVAQHTARLPKAETDDFAKWVMDARVALGREFRDTGREFNDQRY